MNDVYDFKSEELTQEILFENKVDFLILLNKLCDNLRKYEFVAIYTTNEFTKWLLETYDIEVDELYSEDDFCIVTIAYDGNIIVEPTVNDNIITLSSATLTVFDATCPTRFLKALENNEENILIYDFEKEL